MNLLKIAVLTLPLLAGCVSQGRYDEAVAQTRITQGKLERTTRSSYEQNEQLEKQKAEIEGLKSLIVNLHKSWETDVSSGDKTVTDLHKRLTELQAAHAAAEARVALFKDLTRRLAKQIDAGDLTIVIRDGRMVLQLPNDVLFDSGRTELKPAGKQALEAIAEVMKNLSQRQFQVAGHTDNVPIHNDRFASNWELSSGRALGVVHFLIQQGVPPTTLSAAGYGEIDPVAPNDGAGGRKQNRRTEITLQPNIDELVKVEP